MLRREVQPARMSPFWECLSIVTIGSLIPVAAATLAVLLHKILP